MAVSKEIGAGIDRIDCRISRQGPFPEVILRTPGSWRHFYCVFTPVLAKHSKSFSLIDCISVGVDQMQRNFERIRKQVEAWQRSELTDVTAKVVIYEAFGREVGSSETPCSHRARPLLRAKVRGIAAAARSGVFRMCSFKELEPIPQFRATAKLGEFLEKRFSQAF